MRNKSQKAILKTTRAKPLRKTSFKTTFKWVLGLTMPLLLASPRALSLEINYAGRLTETTGKSIEGPLDFSVRFYQSESTGDTVGPTLTLPSIELRDGVFQLSLNLDSGQMATVFGDGSKAVFVEVEAGGKVYPRQRFIAAPMALRVPVDSSQLAYNNDGKLSISQIELSRVSGLTAALAAKADTSTVTSGNLRSANNLSDLTSQAAARTNLGLGPMATATALNDSDISATAAIAQSKISGLATSLSGKEPAITAGTTAQYLRGDKSWTDFNTSARSAVSITVPLTYNSGTGVFGLGQASGVADGFLTSSDFTAFNAKQGAISAATTVDAGTVTTSLQNGVEIKPYGTGAGNAGELRFDDLAAGGTFYVGFKAPDTLAANRIWTLPAADGTGGQLLTTDGSGNLSWVNTGGTGTVTSVNLTQPSEGITVSGGPITGAGSITLALSNDLAAVEGISTTGGVERTAANTWSTYTLTAAGKALIDDADATAQRTTLGLGALSTAASVSGGTAGTITDDTITNADINSGAAIATSKLSGAVTAIASNGLGTLATLNAVGSSEVTDNSIIDADINASAAIGDSKLATISTAGKVSGSAITSGTIAGSTILNTTGAITTSSNISGLGVNGTSFMAGTGDAGASPAGGTIRAASGAGADIPGTNLTVTSGNGTGTGGSGSILFQTAPAAASSSTANTMATRMAITPSGNVGIGTTSPSSKLTVTAPGFWTTPHAVFDATDTSSNNGGWIGLRSGGYNRSYISWAEDSTSGGLFQIETADSGGAMQKRLHISNTGNIGIGTILPAYKLDINGSVRATSFIGTGNSDWNSQNINNLSSLGIGTTSPAGNLSFGGAAARSLQVDRNSTADTAGSTLSVASGGATSGATDKNGGSLVLSSGTATGSGSSTIEFKTASPGSSGTTDNAPTTKMVIDGNGNVGIGTTSPAERLDLGTSGNIRLTSATSGVSYIDFAESAWPLEKLGIAADMLATNKMYFTSTTSGATPSASNAKMTIDGSSGNVGIGTTAPGINTPSSPGSVLQSAGYLSSWRNGEVGYHLYNNGGVQEWVMRQPASGTSSDLRFSTLNVSTFTDRMVLTTGGNVGIGTTAPTQALDVNGNIKTSGNLLEKTATFTPTTVGWYRIVDAFWNSGGTIRLQSNYDNSPTDVEFQYYSMCYGQQGSIQQTRYGNYNNGAVSTVRISSDGSGYCYVDIYVWKATTPGPITVFAYGPSQASLVASPVVGAVAGAFNVATLTLANGFHTTAGITAGGNIGIGTSTPTETISVVSSGSATRAGADGSFGSDASSSTAGNIYSIQIQKTGQDILYLGVNKNTTTGSIPAGNSFISTWGTNNPLSLGRGGGNGLPSTSDIYIAWDGKVGIGTTVPAYALDVTGSVRATSFIGTGNSDWNNQNINNLSSLGIGTTSPAGNLSFGGASARTLQVDRNSTANTAGSTLSVASGGATSGATDKNGGSLVLSSGTATGSGSSTIEFKTASPGSTGTADNAPTTKMVIDGNGNVGIGTTSPAGTIDLVNSSGITGAPPNFRAQNTNSSGWTYGQFLDSTGAINFSLGVGNASAYTFANTPNVNVVSNHPLAFGTNNNERMRITSGGNVGIGTSSPPSPLTVVGNNSASYGNSGIRLESSADDTTLVLNNTASGGRNFTLHSGSGTSGTPSSFAIWDTTANAGRLVINSTGNVGIGTTNPVSLLHVSSGTDSWVGIKLEHTSVGGGNFGLESSGAGNVAGAGKFFIKDNIASAHRFSIDSAGNVGIGTTSPSRSLHVNGDAIIGNESTISQTRTMPTVFNDTIEIGSFAQSSGAVNLDISVVVSATSFSVAKRYNFPVNFNQTAGVWMVAMPISDSGDWYGQDYALDVNVTNGTAALRLRRTGGTTAGTAYVTIRQSGITDTLFTASSATASVSSPTSILGTAAWGAKGNKVGIGTTSPSATLQVAGSIVSTAGTTLTPSGTTQTIDFATSNSQTVDLSSATGTVTLTLSGAVNGGTYMVVFAQGATPRSVVWPATVKWEGATPVVLSGAYASDVITLFFNGTNYFAVASRNFQ